jgi:hypothetical protein
MKIVLAVILLAVFLISGCVAFKCPRDSQSKAYQAPSTSISQQQPPTLPGIQPAQSGNISGIQRNQPGSFTGIQPNQPGSLPGIQSNQPGSLPGLQPGQPNPSSDMASIKSAPKIIDFTSIPQSIYLSSDPATRFIFLIFYVEGADSIYINEWKLDDDTIKKGFKAVYPPETTRFTTYKLTTKNANGTSELIRTIAVVDDRAEPFDPNRQPYANGYMIDRNGNYLFVHTRFSNKCYVIGDESNPNYSISCNTPVVVEVVKAPQDKYLQIKVSSPNGTFEMAEKFYGFQLKK